MMRVGIKQNEGHTAPSYEAFVGLSFLKNQYKLVTSFSTLDVVLFNVLEVLVSAMFDVFASSLVADDDAMLMHLENRNRPHLSNWAFDGSLERT